MLALLCLAVLGQGGDVSPLRQAHAHNDYAHARPLLDALEQGFCSVEADIFLTDGRLLIGHYRLDLRPDRTLQALYLDPLRERAKRSDGSIYKNTRPFYLLIDIKTEAGATSEALHKVLASYPDLVTHWNGDKVEERAVRVVLSGNRPTLDWLSMRKPRFAAYDGRVGDLTSNAAADLLPWISTAWSSEFKWQGNGPMPESEQAKLRHLVGQAHAKNRMLRFWATPEKEAVWRELAAAGVDLLNTDKLKELREFLLTNGK